MWNQTTIRNRLSQEDASPAHTPVALANATCCPGWTCALSIHVYCILYNTIPCDISAYISSNAVSGYHAPISNYLFMPGPSSLTNSGISIGRLNQTAGDLLNAQANFANTHTQRHTHTDAYIDANQVVPFVIYLAKLCQSQAMPEILHTNYGRKCRKRRHRLTNQVGQTI